VKNDGKTSEGIFEDRWATLGKKAFVERLPDTRSIKGAIKHGFIQGRPSDYLVTVHGGMHYAEVKSSSNKTSFPLSCVQPTQWAAMRKQTAAGGEYFIYAHHLVTDRWYRIPASFILQTKDDQKGSIKWTELSMYLWKM